MESIARAELHWIIRYADEIVNKIHELGARETGAVLAIASQNGLPLLSLALGEIAEADLIVCSHYAPEKNTRLGQGNPGHKLSWESRNLDAAQFGGAVRGHKRLYSFSNFTEEQDEAGSLVLAVKINDLTFNEAEGLAAISDNKIFHPLYVETK